MGSKEADFDPISTPKLSFYSLPSKPPPPPGSLTPPLQTLASIPFQWEEAPGKPRHSVTTAADNTTDINLQQSNYKVKAARCLELPPRLFTADQSNKVANIASPTTVFEGPESDEGRSLSHTFSFSFGGGGDEKVGGGGGRVRNMFRSGKIREKSFRFSSWRWGSFKDIRGASVGSFDFSSNSGGESRSCYEDDVKVKMTRSVRRKSSFMSFSNSRVMASIYGSFKQAVPWRRRN